MIKLTRKLLGSGWVVQNKNKINQCRLSVAVREYQTDIGFADYVLFVDKKLVGIIEAKRAEEGVHLTMHTTSINSNIINKLMETASIIFG